MTPPIDHAQGVRALLLDLDGTLADSLGVMKDVYVRFLRSCGRKSSDAEFDRLNGPPLDEVVRILKETHGLEAPLADLRARYHGMADAVYLSTRPTPDARALLESAKKRGWTTGVVTSNTEARTRAWLTRAGLEGLIDVVIGGDSVAKGKPAPDPYVLALKRIKCAADMALVVEDSAQGAAAAIAAGIPTLALAHDSKTADWPDGATVIADLAAARRHLESL